MDDDGREPWLPPGHAERIAHGTLVRVRLSGECPHRPTIGAWWGHSPDVDGAVGRVISCHMRSGADDGHHVFVGFRDLSRPPAPIGPPGRYVLAGCIYAASELEPILNA